MSTQFEVRVCLMERQQFERSLEDVSKVISYAKLVEEDLMKVSQVVCFDGNLIGDDLKLLEVPLGLANQLTTGSVISIRGEEDDNAVLCTEKETFDIKEGETSNSLLLLPSCSLPDSLQGENERKLIPRTVVGVFYKYLEVLSAQPRLKRLETILGKVPYGEKSAKEGIIGHTVSQLLDRVQASEDQIRDGLKKCEGIRIDGEWFLLDQDYQMKILSYILRYFDENSWKYDCVIKSDTVTALASLVPKEITRQVFDIYCSPLEGGEEGEYSLDKDKVCRFYGNFMLAASTSYLLTEFLEMWQKAVPEGITTDIDQLAGLMLVDYSKDPAVIKRFAEFSLPENVNDRLAVLFSARERWTLADITPFIAPLTSAKLNVNALLVKYARALNVGGTKHFCARHGK